MKIEVFQTVLGHDIPTKMYMKENNGSIFNTFSVFLSPQPFKLDALRHRYLFIKIFPIILY